MPSIELSRRNVLGLAASAAAATSIAGFAASGTASASAASTDEVVSWIDRKARRLRTTDPTEPLGDLRGLRRIVGGASVVGLGEACHGSREIFRVKHRMVRYLVEELGFRTLAFEQDFAWGTVIDHYVVTGEGDPRELVTGMSSPLWATEEILDLVTWMRSYNERHRDPVRFFGSDLLSLREVSFTKVTEHVRRVAPDRLSELESELAPLRPRPDQFQWYAGLSAEEKRELIEHGLAVVELLESIPLGSSDMNGEYARQHARAIVGWYQNYTARSSLRPVRERFIAEAITWWKRVHGGRIGYWAANAHTGAAGNMTFEKPGETNTGDWAGYLLRQHFGRGYVSIGTSFHAGSVSSGYAPPASYRVDPPRAGLVDAVLGEAAAADYLLDLRGPAPRPVREWLTGPARTRMVHPDYVGEDDASDHTMSVAALNELFDAIVHIRDTTASRLLR